MPESDLRKVGDLFSDYRAEWSANLFGDLFIAPTYFSKLESGKPCFLIGGRGTGKTTALRSLRFDASAVRLAADGVPLDSISYFGIYVRINKNRVRVFQGAQLSEELWGKAFAHYFNILCCSELCRLVEWLEARGLATGVNLSAASAAFGFERVAGAREFLEQLNSALVGLELYVNNPAQVSPPIMSIREAPLRYFAEALREGAHLASRLLFCCIDEYENLLDSQQAILNTYIKHSEPPLSYKIGVRRSGLRNRATSEGNDVLSTPDDFLEIDIGQEGFDVFARQVVEHRLERAQQRGLQVPATLDEFLPELPISIEAELLGCARVADEVLKTIAASGDLQLIDWASSMPKSQIYFLEYWSEGGKGSVADLARTWMADPDSWATRLGNYGYASLFWLSKGRKGARIRKYYAGARTFISLASGNIRYFIELIDESIGVALSEEEDGPEWSGSLSPKTQTVAARAVGKRRLDQLDGLSDHGSKIKRLVLAFGKVFFEFARDPVGKAPERNSFVIVGSREASDQVFELLHEGVATLAFDVTPRTKATTQREMRDDEFRLHPIFAPFFEYSHRRKRRCSFAADAVLDVFENPARALSALMGREPTAVDELPRQLAMFSAFYAATKARA